MQLPDLGFTVYPVIANQEIVNAINLQIGHEFGAMLQYYAIGAHFAAEGQSELSAHFYEQAEEEKKDALRIIQFVIDTGARVNILNARNMCSFGLNKPECPSQTIAPTKYHCPFCVPRGVI